MAPRAEIRYEVIRPSHISAESSLDVRRKVYFYVYEVYCVTLINNEAVAISKSAAGVGVWHSWSANYGIEQWPPDFHWIVFLATRRRLFRGGVDVPSVAAQLRSLAWGFRRDEGVKGRRSEGTTGWGLWLHCYFLL